VRAHGRVRQGVKEMSLAKALGQLGGDLAQGQAHKKKNHLAGNQRWLKCIE